MVVSLLLRLAEVSITVLDAGAIATAIVKRTKTTMRVIVTWAEDILYSKVCTLIVQEGSIVCVDLWHDDTDPAHRYMLSSR